jgi:hypothetical protein
LSFIIFFIWFLLGYPGLMIHIWQVNLNFSFLSFIIFYNFIFEYQVDWELNFKMSFDLFSIKLSRSHDPGRSYILWSHDPGRSYILSSQYLFLKDIILKFILIKWYFFPVVYIVFKLIKLTESRHINLYTI